MNLILSFIHPTKPAKVAGPYRSITLDVETLRDASTETVVARHRQHQWEVGEERYFRLDATARVRIHFERGVHESRELSKSRSFGPFERFSAVDGLAYTDDRVFAYADAKIGDWFCYDDGRHWELMVVQDASSGAAKNVVRSVAGLAPFLAGVIGLWEGARLLYLGRAQSIRAQLEAFASGRQALDPSRVTAVTWESHPDPAAREAELYAEYVSGARSLMNTYGRLHGNVVRTFRLVERAVETVERAKLICADIRQRRQATLAAA